MRLRDAKGYRPNVEGHEVTDRIKVGDTVEITLRGKVGESGTLGTREITAEGEWAHYVYLGPGPSAFHLDGESKYGATVKKITPPENFEANQAYIDADGDIFIRTDDGKWADVFGSMRRDGFARRPLRKLVPEA